MEEYMWGEIADMAISNAKEFIQVEEQFVEEEHALEDKISYLEHTIAHLDERIPEGATNLHKLLGEVTDKLLEIRELLEEGRLKGLRIEKEQEHLLEQLEKDVKHRDWKAVKKDIEGEKEDEEKSVRLEKHEIKELHKLFIELMKIIKKKKLIKAIEEDLTQPKAKAEYEDKIEYYFTEIYKFARAYERIFRHLWKKERKLKRKLGKRTKKVD